ncbi:MAG TPA: CHAP domain-containing protein [Spirochaetia bacterium]|nr:CHAP domain-containing protein [Spirochaetia bacterium]
MKPVVYLLLAPALFMVGCASAPPARPAATPAAAQTAAPPAAAPSTPQPAAQPQPAATPAQTAAPARTGTSLVSADALGIYRTPEEERQPPSQDELAVIASAKTLIGKPPDAAVTVNGRGFTLDCIGTVSAIYYGISLDVAKDFNLYKGNGVNRLYMTLQERNALHKDKYPRPGDVIFWDNTWDVKGDGDRVHDPRTHAGIVLAVDDDGTIHYVHENLYKGIMIETMNLLRPTVARDEQGKLINSGMAIASKPGGPLPVHTLSGDVFNCFGDVLGQRNYFYVDLARMEPRVPDVVAVAPTTGR